MDSFSQGYLCGAASNGFLTFVLLALLIAARQALREARADVEKITRRNHQPPKPSNETIP
jgi:hypothetical protein